jgi:hypothetical protein
MPSCEELQAPLAIAIAQLEETKRLLLEVFTWAGMPRAVSNEERGRNGMTIALARAFLPVIDISVSKAFKALTGHEPPAMGEWPR